MWCDVLCASFVCIYWSGKRYECSSNVLHGEKEQQATLPMTASSFDSWLVSPTSLIPSCGATVIMSSLYQRKKEKVREEQTEQKDDLESHGHYPGWGVSSAVTSTAFSCSSTGERSSTGSGIVTITTSLISASEGTVKEQSHTAFRSSESRRRHY